MTVRELIMALLLNAKMDDKVEVELKIAGEEVDKTLPVFFTRVPMRVTRLNTENETIIECYDD